MSILQRLTRQASPSISSHHISAAMSDYILGKKTLGEIATEFSLDATEQTEFTAIANRIPVPSEAYSLGGYAILTNIGATYDATNPSRGLGIILVDMTGATQIDWNLQVNKIGTGTQSWQLWNDTDSIQIGVINDAGASGNKTLSLAVTTGIPTGIKRLRIRALSTVTTDDPVYYGSTLKIQFNDRITDELLHKIFMLGEGRRLGYGNTATLGGRLGV